MEKQPVVSLKLNVIQEGGNQKVDYDVSSPSDMSVKVTSMAESMPPSERERMKTLVARANVCAGGIFAFIGIAVTSQILQTISIRNGEAYNLCNTGNIVSATALLSGLILTAIGYRISKEVAKIQGNYQGINIQVYQEHNEDSGGSKH